MANKNNEEDKSKYYRELAKKLKKNTDIDIDSFELNNLHLDKFSIRAVFDEGDADFFFEVSSIEGNAINDDLCVKLNSYDEDGEIIDVDDIRLDKDKFKGHDTGCISIIQCVDDYLSCVKKCKLYVTVA